MTKTKLARDLQVGNLIFWGGSFLKIYRITRRIDEVLVTFINPLRPIYMEKKFKPDEYVEFKEEDDV